MRRTPATSPTASGRPAGSCRSSVTAWRRGPSRWSASPRSCASRRRGAHRGVPDGHADGRGRGARRRLRARRRSSSRSSSSATAAASRARARATGAADAEQDRRGGRRGKGARRRRRAGRGATGFAPGAVAPFPLPRCRRVLIDRALLVHPSSGSAPARTSHMVAARARPSSSGSRGAPADRRRAAPHTDSQPVHGPEGAERCSETEKIWMNGELVDWADAKIHVGAHGLHYGTGVFEGIRCYETPKGPAVFRLDRPPAAAARLRAAALHGAAVLGRGAARGVARARRRERPPECYIRPIAFYGYGELGVSTAGNPVDVVIMSWPWGAYLGEEGQRNGITREDLVLEARRPEHDPARREGDRHLPELDARDHRGAARRLRRGDPAHRRRLRRRRLRREHLRRQGRRDLARRRSRRRSCPGSRATRSSRSRSDLGYAVVEERR